MIQQKNLNVGEVIKLVQTMFDKDYKVDGHFGTLGYPGVMKDWKFRILNKKEHTYHGTMLECEIIGVAGTKGNVFLRQAECVLANEIITLNYMVESFSPRFHLLQDELNSLESKRPEILAKYKPDGSKIKALNKEIEEIKSKMDKEPVRVYLPKFKKGYVVDTYLLQDDKKLKEELISKIRNQRLVDKIVDKKEKIVLGNYNVQTIGGIHVKPNVYGEISDDLIKTLIDKDKKPTDKDSNYLGIEIEMLVGCTEEVLRKALIKERLHKNVQIAHDGSIRPCLDGYKAFELRVLVTENELDYILRKLHKVLSSREVDAYANRSCGLHVHLDMRNRDVNKSYLNLFNVQSLLRNSQPTNRLKSTYCAESKDKDFKTALNNGSRYLAINSSSYKKHNTIEIRVHEGTVNCLDIINWCKFLSGVVDKNVTIPTLVNSVNELQTYNIPVAGLNYIQRRMEQYNNEVVA